MSALEGAIIGHYMEKYIVNGIVGIFVTIQRFP